MASRSFPAVTALPALDLRRRLAPIVLDKRNPRARFSNWAKTFECVPGLVFLPSTLDDLVAIIALAYRYRKQVRAAGAGHSPSDLACVDSRREGGEEVTGGLDELVQDEASWTGQGGWMIRMDLMNEVYEINASAPHPFIHVQAGIFLHDLHRTLAAASPPLAMSNVGSISDQTLGGIITTASHGSGWGFGVMSTMVQEMDILQVVEGQVTMVTCSRTERSDLFLASLCSLGMTGLIASVKLRVEPAFRLREVKEPMSFDELVADAPDYKDDPATAQGDKKEDDDEYTGGKVDEIARSAEHVRMWWYPQTRGVVVARANRTQDAPQPASGLQPHIDHFLIFHVTQFLLFLALYWRDFTRIVGRWAWWFAGEKSVQVDDGYKVFTFDCLYAQYTTEWSIPYHLTTPALKAIDAWLKREDADSNGERIHFPIEIRFVDSDDIWLSPAYGRRTTYIGIVQYKPYGKPIRHERLLSEFSAIMTAHQGRPHWAKQHPLAAPELRKLYPKFDEFVKLTDSLDADGIGMWKSEYTRRHLGSAEERASRPAMANIEGREQ